MRLLAVRHTSSCVVACACGLNRFALVGCKSQPLLEESVRSLGNVLTHQAPSVGLQSRSIVAVRGEGYSVCFVGSKAAQQGVALVEEAPTLVVHPAARQPQAVVGQAQQGAVQRRLRLRLC